MDLPTIEARATAATAGLEAGKPDAAGDAYVFGLLTGYDGEMSLADATFIANARADVLALVARVRELEAHAAELRAGLTAGAPEWFRQRQEMADAAFERFQAQEAARPIDDDETDDLRADLADANRTIAAIVLKSGGEVTLTDADLQRVHPDTMIEIGCSNTATLNPRTLRITVRR